MLQQKQLCGANPTDENQILKKIHKKKGKIPKQDRNVYYWKILIDLELFSQLAIIQ